MKFEQESKDAPFKLGASFFLSAIFFGDREEETMYKSFRLFLALLIIWSLGCAAGQRAHRDRYLITADEIASVPQAETAWDVIRYLRPNLLDRDTRRTTGVSGGMPALVYINGSRSGFKRELKNISSAALAEIKYIDGYEAGGRYGQDSAGGVFLITTK